MEHPTAMKNQINQINGLNHTMSIFSSVAPIPNPVLSNATGLKMPGLINPQAGYNAASAMPGNAADLHHKLGAARGAVIVPCRARGMPVDHNFKTAYFVIPDGIEHGDELMCSYPACRQAGVKFRYCLHCKVPVAKRNFRNRHRHGVPGGDGGSVSGEEDEEEDVSSEEEEKNEGESNSKAEILTEDQYDQNVAGNPAPICMPTIQSSLNVCVDSNDSGGKKEHIIIIPTGNEKDSKKKKSGNVRVPCRARGMPMAHNFKTAYFVISPNIQHGDELVCSFPSCRSAGAKFRYCLHCKVPVAKRNFRNRHKHGNICGDKKKALNTPESPEESSQEKKGDETCEEEESDSFAMDKNEKDSRQQGNEEEGGEEENEEYLKPSSIPEKEPEKTKLASKKDSSNTKSGKKNSNNNNIEGVKEEKLRSKLASGTVSINSSHDATKVQQWVTLLESKPDPNDKQAMAIWMLNLMTATEGPAPPALANQITESVSKRNSSSEVNQEAEDGEGSCKPPKKKIKEESFDA